MTPALEREAKRLGILKPRKKSFDPECLRLAMHFLSDEPQRLKANADDLAQDIQDAVESWIAWERERPLREEAMDDLAKHGYRANERV